MDRFTYLNDPESGDEEGDPAVRKVNGYDESPFFRRLETLEAWIAALSGSLLSFLFVCVLLLPNQLAINMPVGAYLAMIFGLGLILEGPFLYRLWAATVAKERPIGPAVARRAFIGNILVRVLAAAWWFGHVAIAMMFIIVSEVQLLKLNGNIAEDLAMSVLVFGMTVCCNVFIALFVKAVFRTDSAVATFWRWRLLVDITLTVISLVIGAQL